jgi:hypothetical protein
MSKEKRNWVGSKIMLASLPEGMGHQELRLCRTGSNPGRKSTIVVWLTRWSITDYPKLCFPGEPGTMWV